MSPYNTEPSRYFIYSDFLFQRNLSILARNTTPLISTVKKNVFFFFLENMWLRNSDDNRKRRLLETFEVWRYRKILKNKGETGKTCKGGGVHETNHCTHTHTDSYRELNELSYVKREHGELQQTSQTIGDANEINWTTL